MMASQIGNLYQDLDLTPRNMAAFYGSSYFEGAQTGSNALVDDDVMGGEMDQVHT